MATAAESPPRILIIGIGNEYRGDDAAGVAAARRIREAGLDGVAMIENNGDGAALIEAWKCADNVIVIDAVQSGAPPGAIHASTRASSRFHASPSPRLTPLAWPTPSSFRALSARCRRTCPSTVSSPRR